MTLRIGFGYDIHRLVEGRPLFLGGVEIPHTLGLLGHSDGDVLAHALADALLSAAGAGDLGDHFPDRDSRWSGVSGIKILEETRRIVAERRVAIVQADLTVLAEAPMLSPHRDRMRAAMSSPLGCPPGVITIKARTNEGFGAIGRGEAIAAYAVVLVEASGAENSRDSGPMRDADGGPGQEPGPRAESAPLPDPAPGTESAPGPDPV